MARLLCVRCPIQGNPGLRNRRLLHGHEEGCHIRFHGTGELRERESDDPAETEAGVWGDIAEAFSKPVDADEPHIEYVPTQVLAEAFRRHGYDGIVYKSLLNGGGVNIALFDLEAADLMNCGLYKASSVSFDFEPADNPYFRGEHYPELVEERGEVESSEAESLPRE